MVRVRWVVPVILFSLAMPLAAQSKKSTKSTRPPKKLHMVGDHWTAYNPPDPASFPAGSNVHIIARGDTLWALANKYYGNPYLWPQLWETNTYITDAHWIYPGDPLLIQGEISTGNVPTVTDVGPVGTDTETTANLTPVGPPIPLGSESDIYCFGYLGAETEDLPNRVYSFEDVELKFLRRAKRQDTGVAEGDIIFIQGGTSTGLIAGDTYIVVKPAQLVEHPETDEVIGRHYDYRGQVRILCANETDSTAIVVQSCKDINIGDRLKTLPIIPIPLARQTEMADVCTPESGKTNGFIVHAQDYRHALGEGNVVEINLGRDNFVEPGDFLTVYRYNAGTNTPRQILGEVGVLTAEGKTATARITRMRYSMRIGDRVELK